MYTSIVLYSMERWTVENLPAHLFILEILTIMKHHTESEIDHCLQLYG
jgi:hypothetical protein